MKLTAQRNFSIDLFDAGPDDMMLVGSMLDDEHLIKLELTVNLPDEQITKCRLDMIRAPFPVCREVEAAAEQLVGLRIERGVLGQINNRLGGRMGCSHIKELANNIVYFAASHLVRRRSGVDPMNTGYAQRPVEERFTLTKELLRDSCLAYCQTTPQGLDEQIGIRRVGEVHSNPLPLGEYEPSLGALLERGVQRWKDKVFIRYRSNGRSIAITWADFADRVSRIARNLIDQGIRPGDRIGMLSENRAEMYVFELAVMSIGAISVPIFAGYPSPQVAYVLGHARPRFLVVSGRHQLDKIERERHPWIEKYYCMDFDGECAAWGALDFAELTREGGASADQFDQRVDAVQPDDACLVMYTSGTTGPPKGVQLCHRNLISQQKAVSLVWDVSDGDVVMAYLPWHHSFGGLFERTMCLYHGCELCLDDSRGRDVDRMIDNWRAFDPTIFLSVPRVHELMMMRCRDDAEVARLIFGGRLRFVFTAGAPLPAKVEASYRDHEIPVLEGWGLTETSPCCTLTTKQDAWKSGFVGLPIPGVSLRIEADQEILVKGPNVMLGYLNDEEATAQVIDSTGWFRTGDLGEFTRSGLRIFGRKDGAFKLTTGEKVHPQRIENVLVNESPYLSMALSVGSGEDFVGAILCPDPARVRDWAREHGVEAEQALDHPEFRALIVSEIQRLNPMIEVKYHRIRRAVLAAHEPSLARGELTPSGKIVRKALLKTYKSKLDALFAPTASEEVLEIPATEARKTYARA